MSLKSKLKYSVGLVFYIGGFFVLILSVSIPLLEQFFEIFKITNIFTQNIISLWFIWYMCDVFGKFVFERKIDELIDSVIKQAHKE